MFVSVRNLLGLTVLLAIAQTISANYNVTAYCTLVQNNIKLGSIEDCQTFYVCRDGKATEQKCPSGQSFDKNAQTCRISSSVDCNIGSSEPCKGKPDSHISAPGSCRGWIYCQGGKVAGTGECPNNQYFYQGVCHYGPCPQTPNQNDELQNVCDIMPENVYFGSTEACNIWQRCVTGLLKWGTCKEKLVYNLKNGLCDYETPGMCDRVTGENIIPNPGSRSCNNEGEVQGDKNSCNIYYTCSNKLLIKSTCPTGQYYDVNSKSCRARQTAVPEASCDRCQGTKKPFVNAVDPACKAWLSCENGKKTNDGECGDKLYFNEAAGGCWPDSEGQTQYVKDNGACYSPPKDETTTTTESTTTTEESTTTTEESTTTTKDPLDTTTTTVKPPEQGQQLVGTI